MHCTDKPYLLAVIADLVGDNVGVTVGDAVGRTVGETVGAEVLGDIVGGKLGEAVGAEAAGGKARPAVSAEQLHAEVVAKIAFVLGAGADDVEMDVPLPDMGVDSLAAVELANWAQTSYGATVSQTEFLAGLTPQGLLDTIIEAAGSELDLVSRHRSAVVADHVVAVRRGKVDAQGRA